MAWKFLSLFFKVVVMLPTLQTLFTVHPQADIGTQLLTEKSAHLLILKSMGKPVA